MYIIDFSMPFIIFLYGCPHINLYYKTYKIIYIIKMRDILIISNAETLLLFFLYSRHKMKQNAFGPFQFA